MNTKSKMKTETKPLDPRIEKALERLRKSKTELRDKLLAAGKAAGRDFVLDDPVADAMFHLRLKSLRDNYEYFLDFMNFIERIFPKTKYGCAHEWYLNLRYYYDYQIDAPDWIRGFVEGARAQLDELENMLAARATKQPAG